jgi:hypothetical protein
MFMGIGQPGKDIEVQEQVISIYQTYRSFHLEHMKDDWNTSLWSDT